MFCLDIEDFHRTKVVNGKTVVTYRSIPELGDVDDFIARFRVRLPDAYLLIYTSRSIWGSFGNPNIKTRYDEKVRLWYAGGDGTGHPNFVRTLGRLKPTIHQYKIDYLPGHGSLGRTDLDASPLSIGQLKSIANWTTDDPDIDPPDDPVDPPDPPSTTINDPEIGCSEDERGDGHSGSFDSVISAEDGDNVGGTSYDAAIGYDQAVFYDGESASTVTFGAIIAPANPDDAVEFDWATHNGTAIAGTHYTAASGHATVAAGENHFAQAITVLQPDSASGDKTLSVLLANPVNATILDPTAILTIHYSSDPPGKPWQTLDRYVSWPTKELIYNQFADMRHRNRCTAYTAAAAASVLHFVATGVTAEYDPDELFLRAGGSICPEASATPLANGHCQGFKDSTVLTSMTFSKDHPQRGIFRKNHELGKLRLESFHGLTGVDHTDLIAKIKKRVYQDGCVYLSCIWYSNWNSPGSHAWTNGIMPDNGDDQSSIGHSLLIVGWDDDFGFLVQSSHGKNWAKGGRAYLPYSYINRRDNSNGSPSDPWFRFWRMERKSG